MNLLDCFVDVCLKSSVAHSSPFTAAAAAIAARLCVENAPKNIIYYATLSNTARHFCISARNLNMKHQPMNARVERKCGGGSSRSGEMDVSNGKLERTRRIEPGSFQKRLRTNEEERNQFKFNHREKTKR